MPITVGVGYLFGGQGEILEMCSPIKLLAYIKKSLVISTYTTWSPYNFLITNAASWDTGNTKTHSS